MLNPYLGQRPTPSRATSAPLPERELWAEVLIAALRDVEKGRDTGWIGTRDFRIVCTLAGLDPDAVAERFAPPSKAA